MFRLAHWIAIPMLAACWLILTPPVAGQSGIDDKGGYFSAEAKKKASEEIAKIKKQTGKDLLIETFPSADSAPAAIKRGDLKDKADRARFFAAWAEDRYNTRGVKGVYIMLCKQPRRIEIAPGKSLVKDRKFTRENVTELTKTIGAHLKDDPDEALHEAVSYVHKTLGASTQLAQKSTSSNQKVVVPPKSALPAPPPSRHNERTDLSQEAAEFNWVGLICVVLVALLVIWLIFGLIRAFSRSMGGGYGGGGPGYGRPGYGGPGYGGGGGGGYGGGGGGGFFSSLMGGMFGAAAGSWLYNQFSGGSHNFTSGGPAGTSTPYQAGQPDAGGADYASGADYDDNADAAKGDDYADKGGGDAGGDTGAGDAGGGDYGGDTGGDAGGGGGGDFGGGGGDFGGGGGDFGGGGGDFGGGGGDFGGGGGGDY